MHLITLPTVILFLTSTVNWNIIQGFPMNLGNTLEECQKGNWSEGLFKFVKEHLQLIKLLLYDFPPPRDIMPSLQNISSFTGNPKHDCEKEKDQIVLKALVDDLKRFLEIVRLLQSTKITRRLVNTLPKLQRCVSLQQKAVRLADGACKDNKTCKNCGRKMYANLAEDCLNNSLVTFNPKVLDSGDGKECKSYKKIQFNSCQIVRYYYGKTFQTVGRDNQMFNNNANCKDYTARRQYLKLKKVCVTKKDPEAKNFCILGKYNAAIDQQTAYELKHVKIPYV